MNVTGGAVIRRAFKLAGLLGVGQALGGEYLADGLNELRLLVQELRLLPDSDYAQLETVYTLTGTSPVTVGPGGAIDIPRPVRIERGTFVRDGGTDTEVTIVDRAQFARIPLKDTGTSRPVYAWLDAASPVARVHLWPKSTAELHLVTIPALALFSDTTTEHDLPDGYEGYLGALLAKRVAVLYEVSLSQDARDLIKRAERVVEANNVRVPQLCVGGERVDPEAAFLAG